MAGTIADEFDLLTVRAAVLAWPVGIENITQHVNDLDIRLFAGAADIVGLADAPPLEHGANRAAVIGDIQPIPALLTVAIDRQRQPAQRMMDRERNQFFRKLVG